MIKLKNIITNLDESVFQTIKGSLVKNKADHFLFLFEAYKKNDISDKDIISHLNINSNSFYVLKSRLYDKIQEYLAGDIYASKEEVVKQLHQIPDMCLNSPREVTIAFLEKLEKDLTAYDMHNELTVVYSALKKINTFSDKYFYYSQLYNKHIAFNLSLEKSLEILGNFNRVLGQYNFSRSQKLLDTLMFLRKGIAEHHALNPSKSIELIQNVIELQTRLFAGVNDEDKHSTEDVLAQCHKIIDELPNSSIYKNWGLSIDFLYFEYYCQIKQYKSAKPYYDKVNANLQTILLSSHICISSMFLLRKIVYLQEQSKLDELREDYEKNILHDPADVHSLVVFGIYNAMLSFYEGKMKEATVRLNNILNINSFKDYFHINTEIKMLLVYVYLQMSEFDLSDSLTKNVYRKIKTEKLENYYYLLDLIKLFGEDIKHMNKKVSAKQKDFYTLFMARNKGESAMLKYLMFELNKKYA